MSTPTEPPTDLDREHSSWSARVAFGPWWLLYSGPVGPTDARAHQAFQVVVHAGNPLVSGNDGHLRPGPIVIVRPDEVHAFRSKREHVLVIHVDPDSTAGTCLDKHDASTASSSSHPVWTMLGGLRPHSWSQAEQAVHRTVGMISAQFFAIGQRHPAVAEALRLLPDIVRAGDVDVDRLADQVGLSMSRLSDLFTAEVGVPVTSYSRWLRLSAATQELVGGSKIVEAAHRAGFSEAPHFSCAFREMFGLAPSEAVGLGKWLTP